MALTQTTEQIRALYAARRDSLAASRYEVLELCDEVQRLRNEVSQRDRDAALVDRIHAAIKDECGLDPDVGHAVVWNSDLDECFAKLRERALKGEL